jgi:Mg2+-importing ATPase
MLESIYEISKLSVEAVLQKFGTSDKGLTSREALILQELHGRNVLVEEKRSNFLIDFLLNFKNPLVIILLVACGLSFFLGEIVDATIIFSIVILSVALNFFQEYSANKAAQKLKEKISTLATVIRDGKEIEIPISEVTVGDVLVLNAGDLVSADARVIFSKDFFTNQSSLTGESFPVEKSSKTLDLVDAGLSDLANMVFTGTAVETGSAHAVVCNIGKNTEFGKIAHSMNVRSEESEFSRGVKNFSYIILRLTVIFVFVVFTFNYFLKQDFWESLFFAIAIAVGLTPELLPMIMSITMGKGSLAMAKKGVVVKKLTAIPNFGSMDILCTDKTGTLTQDKIELVKYTDVFGHESDRVLLHAYLNSFFESSISNPMDEAVRNFKKIDVSTYTKIDEVPFDFVRKKMSIIAEEDGQRVMITKGAPEEVVKSSTFVEVNGERKAVDFGLSAEILRQYQSFSAEGYRVLAVAIKPIMDRREVYSKNDECEMELIGFISFLDPAKTDVKDVLLDLNTMGIEVKVITGDNELVTEKICRDVGMKVKGVLLGHEINTLTDDALGAMAEKTTIFARFAPDEKNRVIHALKSRNHVVGYMGDGINDAPSLKTADVGISVSNAVDVAKESAQIILTHRSLRVMRDGVIEGRKTFANTMKYIMMGISSNFGNMFSVLGAIIFLPFLPMLPIHILLNNLLYDFSQITIPSDKVDKEYVEKPQRWDMKFIKRFMLTFGPISSIFDFITFILLFGVFKLPAAAFQTGWFLESLATQTFVIYIIRTKKIPFIQSKPSKALLISTLTCVGVGWLLPYTPFGNYFGFYPLPWYVLLSIGFVVIGYLICVELVKRVFYTSVSKV